MVWHTFDSHHGVRPEDWSAMPVTTIGAMLKPHGFFGQNPALDVSRPDAARGVLPHGLGPAKACRPPRAGCSRLGHSPDGIPDAA